MPADLEIKRVLTPEIESVRLFCLNALQDQFPNFEGWLNRTLSALQVGQMTFGYGIFEGATCLGIALYKVNASQIGELKTFYIDPSIRGSRWGTKLYETIEEKLNKQEVKKVWVEVFVDKLDAVLFFLKLGYIVQTTAHLYGSDFKKSYRMEKDFEFIYYYESFDINSISSWILPRYFHYQILEREEGNKKFEILHLSRTVNEDTINKAKSFAFFIEDEITEEDIKEAIPFISEDDKEIYLFGLKFKQDAQNFIKTQRFIQMDKDRMEKLIKRPIDTIAPALKDGIIIPIKQEYYERFVRRNNENPATLQIYLRGGTLGKILKPDGFIFFYVNEPVGGVKGYASIQRIDHNAPKILWERVKAHSVFGEPEFQEFSQGKSEIVGIFFRNLQDFENPVHRNKLLQEISNFNTQGNYLTEPLITHLTTLLREENP